MNNDESITSVVRLIHADEEFLSKKNADEQIAKATELLSRQDLSQEDWKAAYDILITDLGYLYRQGDVFSNAQNLLVGHALADFEMLAKFKWAARQYVSLGKNIASRSSFASPESAQKIVKDGICLTLKLAIDEVAKLPTALARTGLLAAWNKFKVGFCSAANNVQLQRLDADLALALDECNATPDPKKLYDWQLDLVSFVGRNTNRTFPFVLLSFLKSLWELGLEEREHVLSHIPSTHPLFSESAPRMLGSPPFIIEASGVFVDALNRKCSADGYILSNVPVE